MSEKIFITGNPGSGKSTLVMEIVEKLNLKVGGIITPEIKKQGKRIGFELIDVFTGKKTLLAYYGFKGPKIGRYGVNIKGIEKIGVKAIQNALENPEIKLIVIDELGKMELLSKEFEKVIEKVLFSNKNVLVVVHRHLANKYKDFGKLYFLKEKNREHIKNTVIGLLKK